MRVLALACQNSGGDIHHVIPNNNKNLGKWEEKMHFIRARFTSDQNCKNTSIKRPKRGRARGNGEEQDRASRTKRKSKYKQLFLMIKSGAWLLHSSIGEGRGRGEIVLTNVSSRSSPSLPRLLHALRTCNPIWRGRGRGL